MNFPKMASHDFNANNFRRPSVLHAHRNGGWVAAAVAGDAQLAELLRVEARQRLHLRVLEIRPGPHDVRRGKGRLGRFP